MVNKYYLLPSASAYWGQIGYDAGYLIYDQIQYEKSIENIEQYILELADLYNIGPHILINWVVFIFIKILIRNETIQLHKDTMNPYEIIEFLFDLYQSKSF